MFGDSLVNGVPQANLEVPPPGFFRRLSRLLFEVRDLVQRAQHAKLILPASDVQTITATRRIAVTAVTMRLTSSGAVTVTAAPTIEDGEDGQLICLTNVGSNDIIVQDQGTLASSNLRLSGASVTLTARDSVWLRFDAEIGDWIQVTPLVGVV